MSTTSIDKIREEKRVRTSLALLMALDSLDVAHGRIRALAHKAQRGIYNEQIHIQAVQNLERTMQELRVAHAESASMPDETSVGGAA